MDRRRPRWTGLIVGLLLCLPFGVMAHKAPHQTTRSFPVTNGRLLHALAEQLDMSHEDLLAALDPLRNLERLAEENGLTMDELRTTVRSTLQEQRKTSGTSLRERHPGAGHKIRPAQARRRFLQGRGLLPQDRHLRGDSQFEPMFQRRLRPEGQRFVPPNCLNVPETFRCGMGRGFAPRIMMHNRMMFRYGETSPRTMRPGGKLPMGRHLLEGHTPDELESPSAEQ